MKILMISSTFPYPPSRSGTEIRTFYLIKYLQQHHAVTLLTQRQAEVSDADVEALRAEVSELLIFPSRDQAPRPSDPLEPLRKVGRFLESLWQGTPTNVLYRYSPELQAWVDAAVQSGEFDAITCEHSVNAIYIRPEFRQRLTTIVNVHSAIYATSRNDLHRGASPNALRDRLSLSILYRYEHRYVQRFSRLVVTTQDDQQALQKLCPTAAIEVIPNGVDIELFQMRSMDSGGHRLIFVGAMDMTHNIDSACFFALEVMPLLRQRYPEATFSIVGNHPVSRVLDLKTCPGVIVTGRVPSVVEYLHQSTVCVVPLRVGYGIKNKTLEAMATGVPIVGSDRGLEGLAVDGAGVPLRALRANQVQEYVEAISRLFEDAALRQELSINGRSLIETEYTWKQAGQRYEQALLSRSQ